MTFNIKTQSVVETTMVHLVDAAGDKLYDDKGNAVCVEVYGKASKAYRQALSNLSRKNIQRKGKPTSFETNVEDNVELLVAISKAAHNFDMGDGPINTPAKFEALYSDPSLYFLKDAVQEALEDSTAFMKK